MLGDSDKPLARIKTSGTLIDRVDHDQARRGRLACRNGLAQGFNEEQPAKPLSLEPAVHRKTCQQNHTNGIRRQATYESGRHILPQH